MSAKLAELAKQLITPKMGREYHPHRDFAPVLQSDLDALRKALAAYESDRALAALTAEQSRLGMYEAEKQEPVNLTQVEQSALKTALCSSVKFIAEKQEPSPPKRGVFFNAVKQEPDRLDAELVSKLAHIHTALGKMQRNYGEVGSRDVDVAAWNANLFDAMRAVGSVLCELPANYVIDAAKEAKP
jgi:hypothetical protein